MTLNNLGEYLSRQFRYYDSVDSSNDIAMQWLREGAEAGSAVIADEQRRGRGRKGRVWYTPPGVALAVSVILRPPQEYASRISIIGALAVAQMCEEAGITGVGIKWPNDVQINGKKVCGVLPEAAWEGGNLLGVVLGMGVNVRVQFEGELAQTAVSIETELGHAVNRAVLLASLLKHIDYWSQRIHTDELFDAWKSRLNTLGQRVQIDTIQGEAVAVEPGGALLVCCQDGSIQRVLAGDVSLMQS